MTEQVKTDMVGGKHRTTKQARIGDPGRDPQEADKPMEDGLSSNQYTEYTVSMREAAIDAALEMTFPASDPPAW